MCCAAIKTIKSGILSEKINWEWLTVKTILSTTMPWRRHEKLDWKTLTWGWWGEYTRLTTVKCYTIEFAKWCYPNAQKPS